MHLYLVVIPGPTNNTPVLRALEYGVILLLWLFFMWVVRAVGRGAGCGVPIDYDTFASNLHARLFRLDGDVWVEDLGSTNGTWVNTERIAERTRIEKGDLLQGGGT